MFSKDMMSVIKDTVALQVDYLEKFKERAEIRKITMLLTNITAFSIQFTKEKTVAHI